MEKENGEGGEGGKPPPDGMLDPSGLFGAYWGRDGSSSGSAAAAAQAQAQAQAALFGFGSRYPPPTTLGVAANQAASLGLHPAASAAWWSMASHLAAQDYLHRLQASGLNFPPMGDPYSAMSALSGLGMKQAPKSQSKSSKGNDRSGRSSTSSSSAPSKEKPPPTSTPSPHPSMRSSSYGFPKTSSPSSHHSQASMSSLASLNNMVSSHQGKPSSTHSKASTSHSSSSRKPSSSSSSSSSKDMKNRSLDLLRGDLMLAQAAAQGAYHAAVAAAAKGKNMSSLYPFGMPGSDKGRHGLDSLAGLPHNILSDPASVLGGVRLPPDTEIIKYTSSLSGPKAPPGTTNRGRKKTISLDPPSVSVHPSTGDRATPQPNKRPKVDDYSSRSSVEVIRLPNRDRLSAGLNETPPPNLSDYAGISRELLQTIASQSGVSLAALEKQLAGTAAAVASSTGSSMKLSRKSSRDECPLDLGPKSSSGGDDDAPLNLSLKPTPPSNKASDALSCLTSLSSSLSASHSDRISRRKPGAKPRRVMPEMNPNVPEAPRPKSSGSEDSESVSSWPSRESRPRNLGRGVSKPKKNTVASLLAQSRALGLRPALAQQLLAETDLEKLKALLGETASTDSDCLSDSCPSDSDASESGRPPHDAHTRLPLAHGWRRTTVIRGLSRNCNIKGDVTYNPPEPHSSYTLRSAQELHNYLESNPCPPLTVDNFSFSGRLVLGDYVQASMEPNGEPFSCDEEEITKRLEEARALAALTGPRPTPPPVDRRLELARRQQAARDARRDATTHRSRDQARLVRELERNEKAEVVKREKEARSQQLLEHINKNRTQLTIEPLPISKTDIDVSQKWRTPELKPQKDRTMPPISLTLIPINTPKDKTSPTKVINLDQKNWKTDLEQYNALDKMRYFAEKAAFESPKRKDFSFDFSLTKAEKAKADKLKGNIDNKENSLAKLIETYSRIGEFINGCDWSKLKPIKTNENPKDIEMKYLDAKNEYMTENLMLLPKEAPKSVLKEVIDLSTQDENVLNDIISKKINKGTFSFGKDGALSISVHASTSTKDYNLTKRRKHDDHEKVKLEENFKRQQEREIKRQQAMLLKEQQKYINEERERRRQHTSFIRQLDARRRWEERERRKHQNLLDRLLVKEKKLQQRRKEMELLAELRRPQEDSTLSDQKAMPSLNRIPGLKLPGEALANVLQVVEFLHNFGRTLGFDVDNLPTLNSFQMGLLPECSIEDEQEVMQMLTQLLVCAIEDPGIPHPGRHTTLLGHAIRMGDITDDNISEVLRIYLYANATGEVKALTGLSVERERERRIPDHHQTDSEMQQAVSNTRNLIYYEHLHNNSTYKLSEHLRDKPFLALNPTIKSKILAYLCDELLQNKSVLRQIDAGLDNLNQLKKERYLMDMKIRKFRVMCQRKMRAEQTEKQQALALERMQRMVEESSVYNNSLHQPDEDQSQQSNEKTTDQKEQDNDNATHSESEREKEITISEPTPSPKDRHDESDKEQSPLKEVSNSMKSKGLLNNNKDECSPVENLKDKDSVMGDCDAGLSDLESEGTQPEEDEDKSLTAEELGRKLDKLLRQSELQLQQLAAAQHALRPTHLGQDRYWRRYWSLGKCGGIFVESMESAQPEIMTYHQQLQQRASEQSRDSGKRALKSVKEKKESADIKSEIDAGAEALKSELELKNIKSELNLSDHTQIIKYEANVKSNTCKTSGSSIKMEEKFIQHKQTNEEQDMLDIEDSIPTAFLVQKPSHKPLYAGQPEAVEKPQEIHKVENLVKNETIEPKPEQEDVKDDLVNNLEELRKMAEAVSSQLEAAKKEEEKVKQEQKVVKNEQDAIAAQDILYQKIVEGKWFSILRHENSILNNINETQEKTDKPPVYIDNEHTCAEVVTVQGHKWDVSNNLHILKDPSIFTLNSMVTAVQVPTNNVYLDSSLTMSGLDQEILDAALKEPNVVPVESQSEQLDDKLDDDLEKELQQDALKAESIQKAKANNLISLGVLNFNALSTYVTCDSPPPIHMSVEEIEQLESCKVNGLPKKIEGNFVPIELRHGWWRITEPDQLREVLDALHPRGVRERELLAACLQQIPTVNNKLYIDPGDTQYTEFQISNLDRVISQNGGYPSPDAPNSFSAVTARRKDIKVLNMVEQLEERVAAASMQRAGWRSSRPALGEQALGSEIVARARHKLASLEAHIERRYLKPPLAPTHSTAEANIGAAMQAEHGNSSSSSPHNSDNATETKEGRGEGRGALVPRALAAWREALARCNTGAQLAQLAAALDHHVAWDKSIMKANCQFCKCGDDEDWLLLCDGCDKGYHTYCFKPRMEKIPEGDWYCWECVNKARGDKVCIVCGGTQPGRTIPCTLCPRAYHQDCHYPPLPKNPRGKWYCVNCISRAPPKKPRNAKKRDSKGNARDSSSNADDMVPSPSPSHASTSTTTEECSTMQQTPEKMEPERFEHENGLSHSGVAGDLSENETATPEKKRALHYGGNGALSNDLHSNDSEPMDTEEIDNAPPPRAKKEKVSAKRLQKDLDFCKNLLLEMECHEHAWPFLLPVNTKQFPQYKKVIKTPMDLSTIKKKLQDNSYKTKEDFANDVRLIFSNCEVFNEDYSPVGRAGHSMRQFFQDKWALINTT